MATVVLQYAGAALGTLVGGPIGGIIGRAAGAIAGNVIDQKIFGKKQKREGPRLNDLRVMASEEGAAIPVVLGRMRIAGQMIWATKLEEIATTTTQKASGKGGGPKTTSTDYSYFANFAVGLCEGEITDIGRVWADGAEIDLSQFVTRVYKGDAMQAVDSLIASVEDATPAYRDLAYVVFERMPLAQFGNRIPQLSFEVIRKANKTADMIRALTVIPGATEFGYDTEAVTGTPVPGLTNSENAHASGDATDFSIAMDQAQSQCANLGATSLVVTWFGDSLNCAACALRPGVEVVSKSTSPYQWTVNGVSRANAHVVSQVDGKPAFGGTPNDASVVRALQDLKARGLQVMFYPFIMMDTTGYPWRGRITSQSSNKTAAVANDVASFMGNAVTSHFVTNGTSVSYTGPVDWGYRRMILHYAKLCAAAGGVDSFLIGSELRGLTALRSSATVFPFVNALVQLAADVKAILPDAKISYAADWSEYFGHHADGEVFFNLDPLWASTSIDFIGIDNYMPLSDWRDGRQHTDYLAGFRSINDLDYLKSNIAGGEGFDWYYANDADRNNQIRTPISDGAYGKPWVYRYKDLKSWWLNQHFNRPLGIQATTATAWVPQSKPIWFTELGCPAIDKGTNQPNLFVDAKSLESGVPYFSTGSRDDQVQDSYIRAVTKFWEQPGTNNPVSSVYGATMVNPSRLFLWNWDARPFPAFPALAEVWGDSTNYERGHWLNGRISAVDLRDLIAFVANLFGLDEINVDAVEGRVSGFLLDRPMSGRDALEGILNYFAIDVVESGGVLVFKARNRATTHQFIASELGESEDALRITTRTQETELPREVRVAYVEDSNDYRNGVVSAQRAGSYSKREVALSLPAVISASDAQTRAESLLEESWQQREGLKIKYPLSKLALEPGDVLLDGLKTWRIVKVNDGALRDIEAVAFDFANYTSAPKPAQIIKGQAAAIFGQPFTEVLDLATSRNALGPWVALTATPWPGQEAVLRQTAAGTFELQRIVTAQSTMGVTINALPQGVTDRIDESFTLDVKLSNGALSSVTVEALLSGANIACIGTAETGFEIFQFRDAILIAQDHYRLTGLLRALGGTFEEMLPSRASGQSFVLLNAAVLPLDLSLQEALQSQTYRIGPTRFDANHPTYVAKSLPSSKRALRPLRPAQLHCHKVDAGLHLSWIRQSRIDADSWELIEVPLGESDERFTLEILNGANVVRTLDTTTSTYTYLTADILSDFGTFPITLSCRVAQLSASVGAGTFNTRTFNV